MPNVEREVEKALVKIFVFHRKPELGKLQRVRDLGILSPQWNVIIKASPQSTGNFVEEETE